MKLLIYKLKMMEIIVSLSYLSLLNIEQKERRTLNSFDKPKTCYPYSPNLMHIGKI